MGFSVGLSVGFSLGRFRVGTKGLEFRIFWTLLAGWEYFKPWLQAENILNHDCRLRIFQTLHAGWEWGQAAPRLGRIWTKSLRRAEDRSKSHIRAQDRSEWTPKVPRLGQTWTKSRKAQTLAKVSTGSVCKNAFSLSNTQIVFFRYKSVDTILIGIRVLCTQFDILH